MTQGTAAGRQFPRLPWQHSCHFFSLDLFPALSALVLCSWGQELHFSGFLPSGFHVATGNGRQQLGVRLRQNQGHSFLLNTATSSATSPPWHQVGWTASSSMSPGPPGRPLPYYSSWSKLPASSFRQHCLFSLSSYSGNVHHFT